MASRGTGKRHPLSTLAGEHVAEDQLPVRCNRDRAEHSSRHVHGRVVLGLPRGGASSHQCQGQNRNLNVTATVRSEEHTSELQSQSNLVCRLLLEKKTNSAVRELAAD